MHAESANDPNRDNDPALAAAAAAGSVDALGTLYDLHGEAVYWLAYRLTGSVADAEDVLQDVFVGLPRALTRYREEGRFRSWLLRVAARTALMVRRRSARRASADHVDSAWRGGDDDEVINRLAVRDALAGMPPDLRRVFVLRELEGWPHAEIAETLEISSGAARVRLHRAWKYLRDRLEEPQ